MEISKLSSTNIQDPKLFQKQNLYCPLSTSILLILLALIQSRTCSLNLQMLFILINRRQKTEAQRKDNADYLTLEMISNSNLSTKLLV